MGGRFDATNVIKKPICNVITPISMDHMNFLGNSIQKIAYEKAGIIKDKSMVVMSKQKKLLEKSSEKKLKKNKVFYLKRETVGK